MPLCSIVISITTGYYNVLCFHYADCLNLSLLTKSSLSKYPIVDAQIDTSHLKLFLSSCKSDDSERVLSFSISTDLKMNDLCQTLCLKLSGNLLSIFF